jgi:hypothetical protein
MLSALDQSVQGDYFYFAELGLFSLEQAWKEARQSF